MPPKQFKFPPIGTKILVKTQHVYEGKREILCTIENYTEWEVTLQFKYSSLGDSEHSGGRRTLYRKALPTCFLSIVEDPHHEV